YSIVAEPEYRKDIEKNLKKELGNLVWKEIEEKSELIEKSLKEFIDLLVSSNNDRKKYFASIKRTDEKIFDFLKGENETGEIFCSNENRLKKLYHPSDVEMYKQARPEEDGKKYLGSPRTESVKNPVAMKTLHQLRYLINALIKGNIIDQDIKVHIELAREMNDANVRKAIESWQGDNQKKRDKYKEQIIADYLAETGKEIEPSQDEILKYQLWEEQNHICVYTGKPVKVSDFIGADPIFDIEHTIPRSLSYDNSHENKTLCYNRYNREIKKQSIPFELANYDREHTYSTSAGELKCSAILPIIENWKTKFEVINKLIEQRVKQSRAAQTKEQKDRAIQARHKLTFERNYWRNKYKRFIMEEVPSGFKNSQLNDTRLISKFARAFMKSVFDKVYVINGKTTDEFKRIWGLPDKDRGNHIHHAMDAITLAAITKQKNDLLANYYKDEEKYIKPKFKKPWETFTQDVKNIVNDTLIYHVREDNAVKLTRKKVRKRGKIVPKVVYKRDKLGNYILDEKGKIIIDRYIYEEKNGKKTPVFGKELSENEILNIIEGKDYFKIKKDKEGYKYYEFSRYKKDKNGNKKGDIVYKKAANYLRGDSIRGSLHLDTIYGAIQEKGYVRNKADKKVPVKYVIRKKMEVSNIGFKTVTDLNGIVDETVKQMIFAQIKEKEGFKKAIDAGVYMLKPKRREVDNKIILNGKGEIEFEKEKNGRLKIGHPIKKVRIYMPSVKSPLHIKKHRDLSKYEYKQEVHVVNETNYLMAIYKGEDNNNKIIRDYKIVNLFDTAEYYKTSNKSHKEEYPIVEDVVYKDEIKLEHQFNLKTGLKVIILNKNEQDISFADVNWLHSRLYIIRGLDGDGIKLYHHQEARQTTDVIKHMNKVINKENVHKNITERKVI
ncbi:MAG: hypothetical protein K8R79_10655, partial [Calditrichales bacterium]|nr:hypothetical protein [Calditrichales bacterium]